MRGTDLGCAFWARAPFLGLLAHTVSSLTAPLSCQLSGCSFAATFFRKLPLSHTWSSQAQLSSVSLTIPSSAPTRQPPPKPSWVPGLSASISLALSRPCYWLQVWTPNMNLAERSFTGDNSSSHWPWAHWRPEALILPGMWSAHQLRVDTQSVHMASCTPSHIPHSSLPGQTLPQCFLPIHAYTSISSPKLHLSLAPPFSFPDLNLNLRPDVSVCPDKLNYYCSYQGKMSTDTLWGPASNSVHQLVS